MPEVGRVLIAPDDGLLTVEPTWVNLDLTYPNLVAGIDIIRGRQTEIEYTDTSTATVYLNDTDGLFDPENTGSPFFGKIDGIPIMLQLWNPVEEEWVQQTRMVIDGYTYDFNPAVNADGEPLVANVAMECVDLFEYLGGVLMIPGGPPDGFGDPPPVGSEGTTFYEDADFQTRVEQLLADAAVPSELYVVFSGTTAVRETKYDPSDSILVGIRDTLDAEFPGIANGYTDKRGRFVCHGMLARFDPSAVAPTGDWDFHRWKAGDGVALAAEDERAQIKPPLQWGRPRSRIVNVAYVTPRGIDEGDIQGQYVKDDASIEKYGYRFWSAEDLIIDYSIYTAQNANDYCRSIAEWKVENYKDPKTVIEALTFLSIDPQANADHSSAAWKRAQRTWALICGQDISDTIQLEHGYPGGVGISEQFFIEGSTMTIRPLSEVHDYVELTVNVTPESDYAVDPFVPS